MKKLISIFSFIFVLNVICTTNAHAQKSRYAPESGYWQVGFNNHQKKLVTVEFYNEEHQLMHQEILARKMNVNRTKIVRQLYFALKEVNKLYAAKMQVPTLNGLMAKQHLKFFH